MTTRTAPQAAAQWQAEAEQYQTERNEWREDYHALRAENQRLREALMLADARMQIVLLASDQAMAKGSRDLLDWQDTNRHTGDVIRALKRSALYQAALKGE